MRNEHNGRIDVEAVDLNGWRPEEPQPRRIVGVSNFDLTNRRIDAERPDDIANQLRSRQLVRATVEVQDVDLHRRTPPDDRLGPEPAFKVKGLPRQDSPTSLGHRRRQRLQYGTPLASWPAFTGVLELDENMLDVPELLELAANTGQPGVDESKYVSAGRHTAILKHQHRLDVRKLEACGLRRADEGKPFAYVESVVPVVARRPSRRPEKAGRS